MKVTTAQILAEKSLNRACGQACVDWAIAMLGNGRDGHYLTRLAGMLPPHNHFELADLRDRTLCEQGIADLERSVAARTFAAEQLRFALSGDADLLGVLELVADLCISLDYLKELFDFCLLYWAYIDLRHSDVQWYWDGATRENIEQIIRARAERFVREFDEQNPRLSG